MKLLMKTPPVIPPFWNIPYFWLTSEGVESFRTLLKQILLIPTHTPNKILPINIVGVVRIYLIPLNTIAQKLANRIVLHTPNLGMKIPPIKDPIATPAAPIIVVIVIVFTGDGEPSASHSSFLSRTNPA